MPRGRWTPGGVVSGSRAGWSATRIHTSGRDPVLPCVTQARRAAANAVGTPVDGRRTRGSVGRRAHIRVATSCRPRGPVSAPGLGGDAAFALRALIILRMAPVAESPLLPVFGHPSCRPHRQVLGFPRSSQTRRVRPSFVDVPGRRHPMRPAGRVRSSQACT